MQPNEPYVSPPAPGPSQPQPSMSQPKPDYSFLDQQPKKSRNIPFVGNTFLGKLVIILVCFVLIVILIVIAKDLFSSKPFSKSDYLLVAERQQEMLHILSVDVTNTNATQLSPADQNFVSTANLALQTAQLKTLQLMTAYKDKVNTANLAKVYSASIDSQFTSALSTNSFDTYFKSTMNQQLTSYLQDLKAAYASTTVANARPLLRAEYTEAKLLYSALNTPSP